MYSEYASLNIATLYISIYLLIIGLELERSLKYKNTPLLKVYLYSIIISEDQV